jgi:hypothetical protein
VSVQPEERDAQRFWIAVADALRGTAAGSALVRPLTAAPDLDGWAITERLLKDLARLEERAEGWAAGLRLAALSLAGHPDPERFAEEFSGSERTVADYLLAEGGPEPFGRGRTGARQVHPEPLRVPKYRDSRSAVSPVIRR